MARISSSTCSSYLRLLLSKNKVSLLIFVTLMMISAVLEGVGLYLLIPLLYLANVVDVSSTGGGGGTWISAFFDFVATKGDLATLLVVFVFLSFTRLMCVRYRENLLSDFRLDFANSLRNRLFEKIISSKWAFIRERRSSDFLHILSVEVQRISQGTLDGLQLVGLLILSSVYFLIGLSFSWQACLFLFVGGGVFWLASTPLRKKILGLGRQATLSQRELLSAADELLSGLKTAKTQILEEHHQKSFEGWGHQFVVGRKSYQRHISLSSLVIQAGVTLLLAIFVWYGVEVLEIQGASLVMLIVIIARLLPSFIKIERSFNQFLHMFGSFEAYQQMYETCHQHRENRFVSDPKIVGFSRNLILENMSCGTALKNINLEIYANEMVSVIGPSGAGKTTLVDVLCGLIEPTEGMLRADGTPLTSEKLAAWRNQIAYVAQEPFLLAASIEENLKWGNEVTSENDLWKALEDAGAAAFVRKQPAGLQTFVGALGGGLSQGEKQRLVLARALLRNPKILILDEVTSALDEDNSQKIYETLDRLRGRMTIISITHKREGIEVSDRVVEMAEGQIVSVTIQ